MTPAIVKVDEGMRRIIQARSPRPVFFYTEYLDLNLFDGVVPQREMRELLRRKYETRKIDLIVTAGRALRIALHNRADLFGGAPIVFVASDPASNADLQAQADVTGTWLRIPWSETLDLARRLHPGLERAVVVGGTSPSDRVWLSAARRQLAAYPGPIAVSYLADLSVEDILRAVKTLPPHTVVILGAFLRDANGRDSATLDMARQIAAASPVPVYGPNETIVGAGVVGGDVVDFEAHGRIAADLAARVLAGERPAPTDAGTTTPMFDSRQLDRWRIDPRRLPSNSVVLFREPSLWEKYRWYVPAAITVLAVQTGLIGTLLVQRAQRRRAQRSLADRLRFETLLSDLSTRLSTCSTSAVDAEIEAGLRRIVDEMSVERANIWAPRGSGEAVRTHSWTREGADEAPPVIRESEAPQIFATIRRGEMVPRSSARDLTGSVGVEQLGMRSIAVVPLVVGAAPEGALSISTAGEAGEWPLEIVPRLRLLADVFGSALGRQRAERSATESADQIRQLAGQLMTAQEEEGRRIARELHDGVSQDLAAVSIALSRVTRGLPETSAGVRGELVQLRQHVTDISEGVRHLSHELHPGVLAQAGLIAALRGCCHEVESTHGPSVVFHADDAAGAVPGDVALCLYRATQEALRNVTKHASAHRVRVSLTRDDAGVKLTVGDDGGGFDVAEVRRRGGLGLISIEERARLVGGTLAVRSQLQHGTELSLVVPLSQDGHGTRDRTAG